MGHELVVNETFISFYFMIYSRQRRGHKMNFSISLSPPANGLLNEPINSLNISRLVSSAWLAVFKIKLP